MVHTGHPDGHQVGQTDELHGFQIIVTVLQEAGTILLQVQEPENIVIQSTVSLLTLTSYLSQSVTMFVVIPLS